LEFQVAIAVAKRFHFRARMMRSVQISMFSEFQSSLCAKMPDFRREIEVE